MPKMKLSQYAKEHAIGYRTAWNRFHAGKIPNATISETGTIEIEIPKSSKPEFNAVYARVSTSDQRGDLDRQVDRIMQFANAKGYQIHKVYKEVASGLNDQRPKLQEILDDEHITNIFIENKDRLTRFGFNYINSLLKFKQCSIIIMNEINDDKQDLMQDFISIITSFCARIYSKRRSKNQVEKLIKKLNDEPVSDQIS